ncbi:MAG: hypothetical protein RL141_128 [Candidatus Parcubacteria bacterium]|jgi:UDP-GlcNAc:undecaprenyl-phosphate GlcNAc-1-phosphate transferase
MLSLSVLAAVALSWALTPAVRALALHFGAVDQPTGGRKVHKKSTALWGGLATGLVVLLSIVFVSLVLDDVGVPAWQLTGFALGIVILMIGGLLDDRWNLPPWAQFLFPLAAGVIVVLTGSGIERITNPGGGAPIELGWIGVPLSILWLLTVTFAMKLLDGLDGLVAGLTVVGAVLIALLAGSEAYFQPMIAMLALLVAGAYLGFLPHNREGNIFLGEAGSTIAGFSLGVLAILSGAKVATAATALAIPLVDVAIVVIRRLMAGRSPFRGDTEHLHFQLLALGLRPRTVARLIWGVGAAAGLLALTLQTRGKIFLFIFLAALVCTASYLAWARGRGRGRGEGSFFDV